MLCDQVLLVFYKAQTDDLPKIPAVHCRFWKLFSPKSGCPLQACYFALGTRRAFLFLPSPASPAPGLSACGAILKGYSHCLNRLVSRRPHLAGIPAFSTASSLYFLLSSYGNLNYKFQLPCWFYSFYSIFEVTVAQRRWDFSRSLGELSGGMKPCVTPRPVLFLLKLPWGHRERPVLNQGLTNFFCKESDNKYFRLYGMKKTNFQQIEFKDLLGFY